jgi:hypothetical protein
MRYAENQGWQIETASETRGEHGGYKERLFVNILGLAHEIYFDHFVFLVGKVRRQFHQSDLLDFLIYFLLKTMRKCALWQKKKLTMPNNNKGKLNKTYKSYYYLATLTITAIYLWKLGQAQAAMRTHCRVSFIDMLPT